MLIPNKRAFVTGGTGVLGSYLVRASLGRGWEVSALVRTMNKARDLPPGARGVPGDITKPESLRAAMQGADAVFHLAAQYEIGASEPERMWKINVEGTRSVLELAAELGVPKIVYTSTVAVYGMNSELVDESHRLGLRVNVFTVDDPDDQRRLLDWGVDGVFTNVPAQLRAILDGRR